METARGNPALPFTVYTTAVTQILFHSLSSSLENTCKNKDAADVQYQMNADAKSQTGAGKLDIALLVLSIGAGLPLLHLHGWQKQSYASGALVASHAWGFVGLGHCFSFLVPAFFALCVALGESVCALSVACGLFPRATAGAVRTSMAGATFSSFESDTTAKSAYLYAVLFAVLARTGAGKFSFDELIQGSPASSRFHRVSH